MLVKLSFASVLSLFCCLAIGAPIKISPDNVTIPAPQSREKGSSVVVDSQGKIHIVFQGYSEELRRSVVFYRQIVGDKLSEPRMLTSTPAGLPALAVTPKGLFAAWSEKGEKEEKGGLIGFGTSADGGATWTSGTLPGKTAAPSSPNLLADSQGNIFVYGAAKIADLGPEQKVFVFKSSDGGKSWKVNTPTASLKGASLDPHLIETGPGHLMAAWGQSESPAWSLRVSRSDDGGQSWKDPKSINDDGLLPVEEPRIILAGKRLSVLWQQRTIAGVGLVADLSQDGGETWGEDRKLLAQEVSTLDYEAVGDKDRIRVFYVSKSGSGMLLRYKLFDLALKYSDFEESKKRTPESKVLKESAHPIFFSAVQLKSRTAVAASHREEAMNWRVSLFFAEKLARADGILRLAPDLGGRERSLLFAVPLPDGVGVFYREQQARRRLPMESYPGELLFERARVPK